MGENPESNELDKELRIVHFSPGGRIINDGHVPLLTVYYEDDSVVNFVSSLTFWRATPQEIGDIFASLHRLPEIDAMARWIIQKLEMQPDV